LPHCALANHTFLGEVPSELQDLTFIEESAIALCRAKAYIIQLKGDMIDRVNLPNLRGWDHVIIYPQKANVVTKRLPPSIQDIVTPICVLFIGASAPSKEWLQKKARLLTMCGDRVHAALLWLKQHNPLYQDIKLDKDVLGELEHTTFLPFHIKHVQPNHAQLVLQAQYDALDHEAFTAGLEGSDPEELEIPFQNIVITDVDGHASSNELRTAAVRHVKQKERWGLFADLA
ncbi:hypothetical protein L208DRAFT_1230410, partial [Tricholoma matsutake]